VNVEMVQYIRMFQLPAFQRSLAELADVKTNPIDASDQGLFASGRCTAFMTIDDTSSLRSMVDHSPYHQHRSSRLSNLNFSSVAARI
jgi:hypothetical protein